MKQVYISGPMTGLPELNFPAFHTAAKALRAMGFKVTNPAELNPDPKANWRACMRVDIKALCDCDGLVLLPGWEESDGAHLELHLAHRLGIKVDTLDKLLDAKGLRDYWDKLMLGDTSTQAPDVLAFLPANAELRDVDKDLSELLTHYQAELQAATRKASEHKARGDIERHRRSQAAAQAWRRAAQHLNRLAEPF